MDATKTPFEVLSAINCNGHTKKKNGLTYLSWAWAWQMVKQNFPLATYTVYEDRDGRFYHTDGKTAWVKTGVTIEGTEHIEYLPVMDFRNASIALDKLTSFDVNKSIQRSLTKACARHGLGIYIFAGEDLPEGTADSAPTEKPQDKPTAKQPEDPKMRCWTLFRSLPDNSGIGKIEMTTRFQIRIAKDTGKTDMKKVTDAEWERIANALDTEMCI